MFPWPWDSVKLFEKLFAVIEKICNKASDLKDLLINYS